MLSTIVFCNSSSIKEKPISTFLFLCFFLLIIYLYQKIYFHSSIIQRKKQHLGYQYWENSDRERVSECERDPMSRCRNRSFGGVPLFLFFFFFFFLWDVGFSADPFVFYEFTVSYITASPLGIKQQVLRFSDLSFSCHLVSSCLTSYLKQQVFRCFCFSFLFYLWVCWVK